MGGSSAEGGGGGGGKSGCPGIFFSPDPALPRPPVPLFFSFTFSTSPMLKPPPWDTGSFGFGLGAGSVPPPPPCCCFSVKEGRQSHELPGTDFASILMALCYLSRLPGLQCQEAGEGEVGEEHHQVVGAGPH